MWSYAGKCKFFFFTLFFFLPKEKVFILSLSGVSFLLLFAENSGIFFVLKCLTYLLKVKAQDSGIWKLIGKCQPFDAACIRFKLEFVNML